MNIKLLFKISALIFGLIMVIFASRYFASSPFQDSLQTAFDVGARFEWCSAQRQNIKWLDEVIGKKMQVRSKQIPAAKLSEKYCSVQMESIKGIDIKMAQWQKLAQGVDSGGQVVYLERDQNLGVYRAAGLPFKSSILDRDFAN